MWSTIAKKLSHVENWSRELKRITVTNKNDDNQSSALLRLNVKLQFGLISLYEAYRY